MRARDSVGFLLFLLGTFLLVSPLAAADFEEGSPAAMIDRYGKKTVATLNDTNLTELENLQPLRDQLYDELEPLVNFELMTRSALGPQARQVSKEELQELKNVFKPLVIRLYSGRVMEYLVEKENPWKVDGIRVTDQEIRGGGQYAMVQALAHVSRGDTERDLSMGFKLIKGNGNWLVYDLVFENVSLVENYRSQFTSVLANNSIDYLIEQLRQKLDQVKAGDLPDTAAQLSN